MGRDNIAQLENKWGCSCYYIFECAYEWARNHVDIGSPMQDYTRYIQEGSVPGYVEDWVRRHLS